MTDLQSLIKRTRDAFRARFSHEPDVIAVAPGRINIIGEHTDYNSGLALPAAINRWICVAIARSADHDIRAFSLDFSESFLATPTTDSIELKSWQRYVIGAVSVFQRHTRTKSGCKIAISGNVPLGAGLSSSAALEVALMNGLRGATGAVISDLDLIKLCQQVEHEYLGLQSGLLDQFASQFSCRGQLLKIDFYDLSHDYSQVEMGDWCWGVVDSGIRRELASSKYHERVAECHEVLELLKKAGAPVKSIREVTSEHLEKYTADLPVKLIGRLWHVSSENNRVLEMLKALGKGDFNYAGALLKASHTSLRDDYEVSCAELDLLAEVADGPGCAGARIMGGGFGGCLIALVNSTHWETFTNRVKKAYRKEFDIEADFFKFELVGGAGLVSS